MAATIAVLSQKGGTGKTTAVRTLTDVFRRLDLRVLAIDLDPQANLSDYLDVDPDASPTLGDVLAGRATAREAVHDGIMPANLGLAEAELILGGKLGRELALKKALAELKDGYDLIMIDCPPSLGLLTVNALVAAEEVLIPIQCEYYALEGLEQLLRTVELVRGHLNNQLRISTILLTMYDGRTRLATQVADDVRSHFGDVVLKTIIPRSVRVSEAPSYGQSVITYDPASSGALAYVEAARELAMRSGAM